MTVVKSPECKTTDTLIWICAFVHLCRGFVRVTAWVCFWHAYWPSYCGCKRAWLRVQSLCCLICGQATNTVRLSCCWLMLAGGAWGQERSSAWERRYVIKPRTQLDETGSPDHRPTETCLHSLSRHTQRENTAHAYSIHAHIHTHIILSDPQMSMRRQLYHQRVYQTNVITDPQIVHSQSAVAT